MAHTKSGGSSALGRDSAAKRLGLKIAGGKTAQAGQIIARQRGTVIRPGTNVKRGRDDTLYAVQTGRVSFAERKVKTYTGKLKKVRIVSVLPS